MLEQNFQNSRTQDGAAAARRVPAERRAAPRSPVIKSAKLVVGGRISQSVFNCLVLDESANGAMVDLGSAFTLPEEMVLHMNSGPSYNARRRWAAGSKMGLEFVGEELVSAATAARMAEIGRTMRAMGLPVALEELREHRYFGHAELRRVAEEAEAAYLRLERLLAG